MRERLHAGVIQYDVSDWTTGNVTCQAARPRASFKVSMREPKDGGTEAVQNLFM